MFCMRYILTENIENPSKSEVSKIEGKKNPSDSSRNPVIAGGGDRKLTTTVRSFEIWFFASLIPPSKFRQIEKKIKI